MVAVVRLCVRVRAADGLSVVGVVLAWVWAVGRSGGLLRLLMVGCVWRMSSGPVAAVGVAHGLSLPGACWWVVLVAVVVSWVVWLGCARMVGVVVL